VLLGPLVGRVQRSAPGVSLQVASVGQGWPWHELETGTIDLFLGGPRAAPRGMHRRALFQDRVVCILRADHPYTQRTLTLERYLELGQVEALPMPGHGLADEVLASMGRARRLALTVPQFLVAPFVVLHSDYCFTLAERIARPMAEIVPLRVMPLHFEMPI